ncbi:MAG: hypothetical protein KUG77_15605, partial [Nannocystaceae bacterium]|nr:hypothetical protein [Nannocystaceae bacterium]
MAPDDGQEEDDGVFRAPPVSDVLDDGVVGPPEEIASCEERLEAAGVKFESSRLPVHKNKSGITCGAPQAVRFLSGPGGIRWWGKPK